MAIGDIKISSLNIGGLNATDSKTVSLVGFNIYEDILNPLGPVAEVRIIDATDALGKYNIKGGEDCKIAFSLEQGGGNVSFKFKAMQNANLKDSSTGQGSAMHSKQYDIRMCSMELLNAQGNFVNKSFETLTSDILKDILKNVIKTDKQIDIQEPTKGKRRFVFNNEHFLKAYAKLNHDHVSAENKSSCFVCFQQCNGGSQKYVFATFEKLFQQGPVVKLTQTNTLSVGGVKEADKQNSIMWFDAPASFNTVTRSLTKPQEIQYDPTTGKSGGKRIPPTPPTFKTGGNAIDKAGPDVKGSPVVTQHDSANDKTETNVSEARKNRSAFLSALAQNSAELEIPGNPAIKLGSMINLDISKKADSNNSQGESQINGKALVVAIRHKVKPVGQSPRYTMVLRVVKAGFAKGG